MRRRRWPSTPCLLPTAAPRQRDPLARWSRRTPARTRPRLLPLPRRQSSPRTRGATVNGTTIGSLHRPTKPRLPAGRRDSWRRGAAARPGTARTRRPQNAALLDSSSGRSIPRGGAHLMPPERRPVHASRDQPVAAVAACGRTPGGNLCNDRAGPTDHQVSNHQAGHIIRSSDRSTAHELIRSCNSGNELNWKCR
jgi:hypothetical protein